MSLCGNVCMHHKWYTSCFLSFFVQSAQAEAERIATEMESTARRRAAARRKRAADLAKPRTPPAVAGRVHADIQTETYLEELADAPPAEDAATQTDALPDRPPSPLFVPAKAGVDAGTQIAHGELFDFDLEVEPTSEAGQAEWAQHEAAMAREKSNYFALGDLDSGGSTVVEYK